MDAGDGNAAICRNIISASLNVLIFQTCPHPRSLDPANLSSASCIQCPRCCQMGRTITDTKWALGGRWLLLPMHVKCPIRLKSLFIISWRQLNLEPPCAWHQIWGVLLLILMDLREQNIEFCLLVFDAHQQSWLVRDMKFIWGLERGCFSLEYFFWQLKQLPIQQARSPLRAAWWGDIFGLMDKVWLCILKCLPLVKTQMKKLYKIFSLTLFDKSCRFRWDKNLINKTIRQMSSGGSSTGGAGALPPSQFQDKVQT